NAGCAEVRPAELACAGGWASRPRRSSDLCLARGDQGNGPCPNVFMAVSSVAPGKKKGPPRGRGPFEFDSALVAPTWARVWVEISRPRSQPGAGPKSEPGRRRGRSCGAGAYRLAGRPVNTGW